MQKRISLKFFMIYEISASDREAARDELKSLLDEDGLQRTVGRTLRLGQTALAHELPESGDGMGNVILSIAGTV